MTLLNFDNSSYNHDYLDLAMQLDCFKTMVPPTPTPACIIKLVAAYQNCSLFLYSSDGSSGLPGWCDCRYSTSFNIFT